MIFRYRGRPVIAVPIDNGLAVLRASVLALPDFTLKRRVFKSFALLWSVTTWLWRGLGFGRGAELPASDQAMVERIRVLCPEATAVAQIWSLVPDRPRIYFRVFDAKAREIAFAKVSTAGAGRERLQIEAEALKVYCEAKAFDCPQVLALDVSDETVLLLTTALPQGCQLLHAEITSFPQAIRDEIRTHTLSATLSEVQKSDWYRRSLSGFAHLAGIVADRDTWQASDLILLAPAHGDFGSENFYVDPSGRVSLVDWEHYNAAAPILTDEVGFWIGRHHRAIQRGDSVVGGLFKHSFHDYSDTDILLALVYLYAFDIADAKLLANLWKP